MLAPIGGTHCPTTSKLGNITLAKAKKKYIRYLKNTFLVSSDNWATVKKEVSISNEYILEDNLDLIYRGKLIQKIGVEKANVVIAELNKIRKLLMQEIGEIIPFLVDKK